MLLADPGRCDRANKPIPLRRQDPPSSFASVFSYVRHRRRTCRRCGPGAAESVVAASDPTTPTKNVTGRHFRLDASKSTNLLAGTDFWQGPARRPVCKRFSISPKATRPKRMIQPHLELQQCQHVLPQLVERLARRGRRHHRPRCRRVRVYARGQGLVSPMSSCRNVGAPPFHTDAELLHELVEAPCHFGAPRDRLQRLNQARGRRKRQRELSSLALGPWACC